MNEFPKISIVTPSLNQGRFLEQTICSVLDQQYPNLEYIVMDGGSTDGSVEIIEKYASRLSHWESRRDNGQADAVYRGFRLSSGEILGYLNSDDYYFPGTLLQAAKYLLRPERHWLIGGCATVDSNGKKITKYYGARQDFESLVCYGMAFYQMSCFWKREVFFKVGGFDRTLRFCFDYDLFLRLAQLGLPVVSHRILSAYRIHENSKTSTIANTVARIEGKMLREKYGVLKYSEKALAQIAGTTLNEVAKSNQKYFLLDLFKDPEYFLRANAARIRDSCRPTQ